jgi:hypothetical protein
MRKRPLGGETQRAFPFLDTLDESSRITELPQCRGITSHSPRRKVKRRLGFRIRRRLLPLEASEPNEVLGAWTVSWPGVAAFAAGYCPEPGPRSRCGGLC